MIEAYGQQNLTRSFGLLAGYQSETYNDLKYSGWRFGSNWLVGRILGKNWRSDFLLSLGLGGLQGPSHSHSTAWAKFEAEWETRNVLIGARVGDQRGTRMSPIHEIQGRVGYSPLVPEMNSIQPWFVFSSLSRSGTGNTKFFAILRLLNENWWLELGTALNSTDKILRFAVAL